MTNGMKTTKMVLGGVLVAVGVYSYMNFEQSMVYIHQYPMIFSIVIGAAGLLLLISKGR